jgi:hypothetical protein
MRKLLIVRHESLDQSHAKGTRYFELYRKSNHVMIDHIAVGGTVLKMPNSGSIQKKNNISGRFL